VVVGRLNLRRIVANRPAISLNVGRFAGSLSQHATRISAYSLKMFCESGSLGGTTGGLFPLTTASEISLKNRNCPIKEKSEYVNSDRYSLFVREVEVCVVVGSHQSSIIIVLRQSNLVVLAFPKV
jgi:hypothetical protein